MPEQSDLIWLFFKNSGRVNRAAYFLGVMLVTIVQAFPIYHFERMPEGSPESQVWWLISAVVFIGSLWPFFALAVKRLHDLDRPGIVSLVLFVPVLSILAFLVFCLYPGQPGPNRYGRRTNAPAES
ncbi:MAG: DUF805 domain-containing protein [Pseudomonadota bacterium]